MSDSPLMLSISGCRGIVGKSFTPESAARYGAAVGTYFRRTCKTAHPHILVGRDSRPSGLMFESAAVAGLLATGCRVTRLGLATTPGVGVMVDARKADGAIILTASHNPIEWNGIKTVRHDGIAPPTHEAQQIIDAFKTGDIHMAQVEELSTVDDDASVVQVHMARILSHVDVETIRKAKLRVALDSVHGVGGPESLALLEALGVEVVHLYGEPTGQFPRKPEPTQENLVELSQKVATLKVDAGFAQDPDADRLAIIDENGRYVGEEYTLVLAALHRLKAGETIATNLSTSRMVDDVARELQATVIRTPVGEANVAQAMVENNATLGGEGNGGIIFAPVTLIRDSLVGMAFVLEMLAQRKQRLSEIVDAVPSYAMLKTSAPASAELVGKLSHTLRDAFARQRIDDRDGVRVDWADQWVHVRPSNTEPIVRLIAEAATHEKAEALLAQVREVLGVEK